MAGFDQPVRVGGSFERQDMAYVNLERALLEQGRTTFKYACLCEARRLQPEIERSGYLNITNAKVA